MNSTTRIGIIGAMDIEVETLRSHITHGSVDLRCGMEFVHGTLGRSEVVLVMSGVGKVNAALCTQVLIDRFGVGAVINTGVAGGVADGLTVGDIVVGTDCVYRDMDVRPLGYELGQVPGMDTLTFPIDERLATNAVLAAESEGLKDRVVRGRVASGDTFVASVEEKDFVRDNFGAACADMEGAAIAHACYLNHTPCLVMRVISDTADGAAAEDYPTFKVQAANACASIVERMNVSFGSGKRSTTWGL